MFLRLTKRKWNGIIIGLIMLAAIILTILVGQAYARYQQSTAVCRMNLTQKYQNEQKNDNRLGLDNNTALKVNEEALTHCPTFRVRF